jgi:hypothetical protein
VHYVTQDGVKMNFRKFFKFPVAKPLDVRTKFYNADVSVIRPHTRSSDVSVK